MFDVRNVGFIWQDVDYNDKGLKARLRLVIYELVLKKHAMKFYFFHDSYLDLIAIDTVLELKDLGYDVEACLVRPYSFKHESTRKLAKKMVEITSSEIKPSKRNLWLVQVCHVLVYYLPHKKKTRLNELVKRARVCEKYTINLNTYDSIDEI